MTSTGSSAAPPIVSDCQRRSLHCVSCNWGVSPAVSHDRIPRGAGLCAEPIVTGSSLGLQDRSPRPSIGDVLPKPGRVPRVATIRGLNPRAAARVSFLSSPVGTQYLIHRVIPELDPQLMTETVVPAHARSIATYKVISLVKDWARRCGNAVYAAFPQARRRRCHQ